MQIWSQFRSRLRAWARALKRAVVAVWFAAHNPATPWYARLLALCVAAYAPSPIDLIPDFIPVLGYLDDVIVLPIGIWLVLHRIPPPVMDAARVKANAALQRPVSRCAALAFIATWILLPAGIGWWVLRPI